MQRYIYIRCRKIKKVVNKIKKFIGIRV